MIVIMIINSDEQVMVVWYGMCTYADRQVDR